MKPIIALARDHVHVKSPFCGDLIEVLRGRQSAPDIAVLIDVRPTKAHYHNTFEEVYFVLDGALSLRLFDPDEGETEEYLLAPHEVCVIPRRTHHQIASSSYHNRLCVLCIPCFDPNDETPSDKIGSASQSI